MLKILAKRQNMLLLVPALLLQLWLSLHRANNLIHEINSRPSKPNYVIETIHDIVFQTVNPGWSQPRED